MAGGINDDAEIFQSGNAPDPAPSPALPLSPRPPDAAAVSQAIRGLRNGVEPELPPEPPPPAPAPAQPGEPEDRSQAGMLRALLDERDRRQDLTRQLERYQRQERETQEKRPPLSQRLFEQPDEVLSEIRTELSTNFQQQLTQLRVEQNMELAAIRHEDVWDEAFQTWHAAVEGGKDAGLYFSIMNSRSPGEALVQWYNSQQVFKEVGADPKAYKEKLRVEILRELGVQPDGVPAPVPARSRDEETGQFTPRQQVRLPSAPGRMGNAGNGNAVTPEDGSDAAIFESARPQRRR